jgi:hypothetical protein
MSGCRFIWSVVFATAFLCAPAFAQFTVGGNAINESTWNNDTNTSLANPPGDGTGAGTMYVGVWSPTGALSGPPSTNSLLATTNGLPFGSQATYAYTLNLAGGDYVLAAWVDADGNAGYDEGEPRSAASTINLSSNNITGLNITIVDDADGDGMADWWEKHWFNDLDETGGTDTDNDGLSNQQEFDISKSISALFLLSGANWDSDNDTMDDGWEYDNYCNGTGTDPVTNDAYADADGDGLINLYEYRGIDGEPPKELDSVQGAGFKVARNNGADTGDKISPVNVDTDGDHLVDSFEAAWYHPNGGIDPLAPGNHGADPDGDGLSNYREQCLILEFRENGSNDLWSTGGGSLPSVDGNGLRDFLPKVVLNATNSVEIEFDRTALRAHEWTDPSYGSGFPTEAVGTHDGWDTDDDLLPDGWEVEYNLDPRSAAGSEGFYGDPDGDGLLNYQEYEGQDGDRSSVNPYLNGTGDETNPFEHNWRPNSTGPGAGTERPSIAASYWRGNDHSPDWGTLGAALPTASVGIDTGTDTDEDGAADSVEIQQEFGGSDVGASPVHSMHPFIKRAGLITNNSGIIIPDPEGGVTNGGYRPLLHGRNWTLECQVKLLSSGLSGYLLNCPGPYGGNDVAWRLELSNDIPVIGFHTLSTQIYYKVEGLRVPTNRWTHIAGVWDTDINSLSLFIDGIFMQEQRIYEESLSGYMYAPESPPTIGTSPNATFANQLQIDEVRVWNLSRTPDEIEEYRSRLVMPGTNGLVAYFRFDDGGTTAEDFARKAKNGLLGAASDEYLYGDHGYALNGNYSLVTNDHANVRGVHKRGADDSDGDGMPDGWEMVNHLDPFSAIGVNGADGDADSPSSDGLKNLYEFWSETNPKARDTDQDSIFDGNEDYDGDKVVNKTEQDLNSRPDMVDTDDDGLTDSEEQAAGTSPADPTDPGIAKYMWFGGSTADYLAVPNQFKQRLTDWTLEAWVNTATNPVDAAGIVIRRVVETPTSGTNGVNFVLGIETNGAGIRPYAGYSFVNGTAYYVRGQNITMGTWVHLAASYDSLNARLMMYTNGIASGSPVTDAYIAPPINGKGGETFVRMGEDYQGGLHHVRVWNEVRTVTEIITNTTVSIPGSTPGLVHYFRFDDGQATTNAQPFGQFHQPYGPQDFTVTEDWHEEWRHAAIISGTNVEFRAGGAVVMPPTIAVILQPEAARDAGAQWTLDSSPWYDSGQLVSAGPGDHVIGYKSMSGWTAPANELIAMSNSVSYKVTRTYIENGSLTINIQPAAAISNGASWAVDGGPYQGSGTTVGDLAPGTHLVSYSTIAGWNAPVNHQVTILEGQNTTETHWYTPVLGRLLVYLEPPQVVSNGAQWRVDSGTWRDSGVTVTNLGYGEHSVEFSPMPPWISPSNQTIEVVQDGLIISTGLYTQVAGIQVDISPPQAIADGAQWRLTSGSWQDSGTFLALTPGDYTIEFKEIGSLLRPGNITTTVVDQVAIYISAYYYDVQILAENGTAAGQVRTPRGVAINERYLYVADSGNNRIQVYDTLAQRWWSMGSAGTGAGQFNQPYGIDLDSAGNLWVADAGNDRIQRWTAATGAWTVFGGVRGTGLGQFNGPFDIQVDSLGNVFVADHYNRRVQKRTAAGAWSVFIASGSVDGTLRYPDGLGVDSQDSIYVSDFDTFTDASRIQKFSKTGVFLGKVASSEEEYEGDISRPMGLEIGLTTNLYVADTGNSVVTERGSTGGWFTVVESGLVISPEDVAVDVRGNVYVADTGSNRVLMLPLGTSNMTTFVIQAEDFDLGGEGVGYHDTTVGNEGGAYRLAEDVDILQVSNAGQRYCVGWTAPGEWMRYTVTVPTSGTFTVKTIFGAVGSGGAFHIEVDGTNVTGSLAVPNTGGWTTWASVSSPGITLSAGQHVFGLFLNAAGSGGFVGTCDYMEFSITSFSPGAQTPYGGVAWAVPGSVEIEDFDVGGQAIAYSDTTVGNEGGAYRGAEDVDIAGHASANNGNCIGWTKAGEWLEYTINVASSTNYTIRSRVASLGAGGTFHYQIDGTNVTGSLTVPNTGGWYNWQNVSTANVAIAAGQHVLRLAMDTVGASGFVGALDTITLSTVAASVQAPYGGVAWVMPGTVEVENFDTGGQTVAYSDTTGGNEGGAYRGAEDVDIVGHASANNGNCIGWTKAGEWLEYTINVVTPGSYVLQARVASLGAGGTFHIELDGTNVTGSLTVPNTGDWFSWQIRSSGNVSIGAGQHVMRLSLDSNGALGYVGAFDYVRMMTQTPYGGVPWTVPGAVNVENFDVGGQGLSYSDTTGGNAGGSYRTGEDVDIAFDSTASNNQSVGWTKAGEWMEYTITNAAPGPYVIQTRVASVGLGGTFHIELDGTNVAGPMLVPNTGGWSAWTTVNSAPVAMGVGQHVLRLAMDSNGGSGFVGAFDIIGIGVAVPLAPPPVTKVSNTDGSKVYTGPIGWQGPLPSKVLTSDDTKDDAPGWAAVDGDENTVWTGDSDAGGWWIVLGYDVELSIQGIDILVTDSSLAEVIMQGSVDAETWYDVGVALRDGQFPTITYLWFIFPDDGSGAVPQVKEIVVDGVEAGQ